MIVTRIQVSDGILLMKPECTRGAVELIVKLFGHILAAPSPAFTQWTALLNAVRQILTGRSAYYYHVAIHFIHSIVMCNTSLCPTSTVS